MIRLNTNRNGIIFNAAAFIFCGSAISCVIATAVTGDAAGVAIANCDYKNNNAPKPVGAIPICIAKLTKNGITNTITNILFATLVNTAANNRANTINTSGGRAINGFNKFAIAVVIPAS